MKLRGRIILLKVFGDPAKKSEYSMRFQKVLAASSPRKGVPMKPSTPAEIMHLEKHPNGNNIK